LENDFTVGKIDKAHFIKTKREDFLIIQVYVGDIIFDANKNDMCHCEFNE